MFSLFLRICDYIPGKTKRLFKLTKLAKYQGTKSTWRFSSFSIHQLWTCWERTQEGNSIYSIAYIPCTSHSVFLEHCCCLRYDQDLGQQSSANTGITPSLQGHFCWYQHPQQNGFKLRTSLHNGQSALHLVRTFYFFSLLWSLVYETKDLTVREKGRCL